MLAVGALIAVPIVLKHLREQNIAAVSGSTPTASGAKGPQADLKAVDLALRQKDYAT
ncbi:hypothetical protein [Dyella sp. C9]|uniref:hypothetical protein n=1 Tax=Dyella sp. C9 TaxID=2202154 RepID=UPI0018E55234|nr:hypothetical protein [Dyella sp. C9]